MRHHVFIDMDEVLSRILSQIHFMEVA